MTGSFGVAGLVSAGMLIGVSCGSVVQGRIIDRIGPIRPLLIASGALAVAGVALVVAIESRAPLMTLLACAVVVGLAQPAMPGASRTLWTRLVPPGRSRDAAFSYEAISLEVFFILGPSLAALLVLLPWPGTGTAVALVLMVTGSAAFALTHAVRTQRPVPAAPTGLFGALAVPGLRTIVLASLGFGLVIGSVEVGVPAVTAAAGSAALGGVLLSAWSITSVLAGVAYSLRPWPRAVAPAAAGAAARVRALRRGDGGGGPAARAGRRDAAGGRHHHAAGHRALPRRRGDRARGHGDRGVRLGGHGGHAGPVVRAVDGRHRRGGVRAARGVRGRRRGGRGRSRACSGCARGLDYARR